MPFKTSYFNKTLFLKTTTRFWPVWAVYTLIWGLLLPLNLWNTAHYYYYPGVTTPSATRALDLVLSSLSPAGVLLALSFALLAAMSTFSYLFQSRSANLMHTLPIRREGLFLTNYLAGLAFLIVPNAAIALLTGLVAALSGVPAGIGLLTWFAIQSLVCLFFYSFAVFCAMFTGHLLALPFFYGVFNILVLVLVSLAQVLLGYLLYGFVGLDSLGTVVEWLTPAAKLIEGLRPLYDEAGAPYLRDVTSAIVYGVLALVLAACALPLYRRRHMERAGDVVVVRRLRPVFRYGVAFCSATCIGYIVYDMFFNRDEYLHWPLIVLMLLWGAIGYFVAEMFLQKSFRVFKKWRGCAVFLGLFALLCAGVVLDFVGFETRVPSLESIASVQMSGPYGTYPDDDAHAFFLGNETDPAILAAVIDTHRAIIAERDSRFPAYQRSVSTTIRYTLHSGQVVQRQYRLNLPSAYEVTQPAYVAALDALINLPAVAAKAYAPPTGNPGDLPVYAALAVYNPVTGVATTLTVSATDAHRLYAAVQADAAAGRFPRHLLPTDENAETYYHNHISFHFRATGGRTGAPDVPRAVAQEGDEILYSLIVRLQVSSTETLRVYSELVAARTDDTFRLITEREWWETSEHYEEKKYW